jgi:Ig-like domain from next to BRCA1 gene
MKTTRVPTLLTVIALAGCIPSQAVTPTAIASVAPTPATTVPPATVPTTAPTVDPRCPEPTEGTQLLAHEADGYCFLYPDGLLRVDPSPHAVCLVPEGATLGCQDLVAAVEVADAEGRTAAQIGDEKMLSEGDFEPGRCTSPIAGIQTVVLTEAGGQGATCEMLFVREDRLYTLKFALPFPDDPPEVGDALDHLFNTVTASFTLPPVVAAPGPAKGTAVVAYVQEGDLRVWSEATGQTQIVIDARDVIRVELSDDGELTAFVRRSNFAAGGIDNNEQSALWVVGLDGSSPRELVPAGELRALLNAAEADSTDFTQLEWIPNSHRLLYSGSTYSVIGQGGGAQRGVYLVDADSSARAEIAPAETSPEFAPSPDGGHVAMVTPTGLSFYSFEGGRLRRDVLTYPATGVPFAFTPWGVWTQDSSAFLIAAPAESGITIWRVPVEGGQPQALITVDNANLQVIFAPDGSGAAMVRQGVTVERIGSAPPLSFDGIGGLFGPPRAGREVAAATFIVPLPEGVGPLAAPRDTFVDLPVWSPGGSAYVFDGKSLRDLYPLCPGASQMIEVCGPPIRMPLENEGPMWVDGNRFLYVTIRPRQLYLGDLAGGTTLVAEDPASFDAVAASCRDDSEFVLDVTVPDGTTFEPGTVFRKIWRIRNSGTCMWDAGYRFAFLAGDRMSGPRSTPLGTLDRLPQSPPLFPIIRPGEEIELSVTLIAPSEEGTYQGQWQLFAPDGMLFGTRPYVAIQVP